MQRHIDLRLLADKVIDDGDMLLRRALPHAKRVAIGPFVFIDHYQHRSMRGIGDQPHPHAGIEVVSYLVDGSVQHRDSMGFRDTLNSGDAQFIRSGKGMLHAEQPLSGRHGLQLWLALPPELMDVDPTYQSYRAADIPTIVQSGASLNVIAGRVNSVHGPMQLSGEAAFAHVSLESHAQTTLEVDTELELALYVLKGHITVGGTALSSGDLGVLSQGSEIELLNSGHDDLQLALIGGARLDRDVLFLGPFVADNSERLQQAKCDFISGRMGRLEGVPY